MKNKILFAKIMRDVVHNLDANIVGNKQEFNNYLSAFIRLHEGVRNIAYDDETGEPIKKLLESGKKIKGNVTIGIGFNMDSGRREWADCFNHKISYSEIYYGKKSLTDLQIDRLFYHTLNSRIKEIENIYSANWVKLKINEQIAIIDAYFNSPKIVGKNSKFKKNIDNYISSSLKEYLLQAVSELKNNSNPHKHLGIKNRRDSEATLLDSSQAPFWSLPNEPLIPSIIRAIPEHTIIPRGINFNKIADSKYFIWRANFTDKIIDEHFDYEGKIFEKSCPPNGRMPKESSNCNCYVENLTDNILIE